MYKLNCRNPMKRLKLLRDFASRIALVPLLIALVPLLIALVPLARAHSFQGRVRMRDISALSGLRRPRAPPMPNPPSSVALPSRLRSPCSAPRRRMLLMCAPVAVPTPPTPLPPRPSPPPILDIETSATLLLKGPTAAELYAAYSGKSLIRISPRPFLHAHFSTPDSPRPMLQPTHTWHHPPRVLSHDPSSHPFLPYVAHPFSPHLRM